MQNNCIRWTSTHSSRVLYRFTQAADDAVVWSGSNVHFDNATCAGTGTIRVEPDPFFTITLTRAGVAGNVVAGWGWVQTSNARRYLTSGVQGGNYLCLVDDAEVSIFPTATDVASMVDRTPAWQCFARR